MAANLFSGTGDPNGVVFGSPGDAYLDVGASISTLWIKESGVGTNTGWTVGSAFMKAHVTQLGTQTFNAAVAHAPGSGIYDVFLTDSLPGPLFTAGADVTLGVEVVTPNPPIVATYEWLNPGQLRVSTWDLGGVLTDPFGISVTVDLV